MAAVPPRIIMPVIIPILFIRFSSKNSALSGGVGVGGKVEDGDQSVVKCCNGANPSGIECRKGTPDPPDIDSSEGIDPSGISCGWDKGANPPDVDSVAVGALFGSIRCGDSCISDGPEVPELEG